MLRCRQRSSLISKYTVGLIKNSQAKRNRFRIYKKSFVGRILRFIMKINLMESYSKSKHSLSI